VPPLRQKPRASSVSGEPMRRFSQAAGRAGDPA